MGKLNKEIIIDPIKEVVNPTTQKITYEYAINLGVPPGETKPFRTRRRGFATKKEAWKSYMLLKTRAEQGIFPERQKGPNKEKESNEDISGNSTVNEFYPIFWQGYLSRDNELTTNYKTEGYFINHILPEFGTTKLKDITPIKCRKFSSALLDEFKSGRQILIYFKCFLDDAIKMKLIDENPMDAIRIPTKTEVIRKKKIPGEEDVFFSNYYSREELNEFLACTEAHCSPMKHTFFSLLAHCGLRRGEAFALTWKDIDFEKKLIHVTKSAAYVKGKNMYIKNTKNYVSRKINVDDATIKLLIEWKSMQQQHLQIQGLPFKKDHEQLVFQNSKNELINPSQTSEWLTSLYKKCDFKKITVHGLRHTHCTLGLQSRAFSVEEMMNRLGHKDIQMTMLVYTHVTEDTMQDNPAAYMEFLAEAQNERKSA